MVVSRKDWTKLLKTFFRKWNVLEIFLAILVPVALPSLHMLVFDALWGELKSPVDKEECRCSCWDTIFKGSYEYGDPRYKHVYFNHTSNTFKMWAVTVMMILCFYSSFRHFFSVLFAKQMRWSMGVLFLANIHNQYYAWWMYWNFWNDEFYPMWNHGSVFAVTEGISFVVILVSLDRSRQIQPFYILTMAVIAIFHVLASCSDQFIDNVIHGYGDIGLVLRDVLFMTGDLLTCTLSLFQLRTYAGHKEGVGLVRFLRQRPFLLIFSATLYASLFVISRLVPNP